MVSLLPRCDMLLTSTLFRHRPRRQQPPICLDQELETIWKQHPLFRILIFPPALTRVSVCFVWCMMFHELPRFCQLVRHIWELASVTPPNLISAGFGCATYLLCFELRCMIIFVFPMMWFLNSLDWPWFSATHKHSTTQVLHGLSKTSICHHSTLLCAEAPPIFDLCWTCPGPRPPLFSLCGFLPDHHLGSRPAHSSHHTPREGGTHLSHFWVPACCMFCRAARRNNVAWRNSRSPLSAHIVAGASCSGTPPSLMLDRIPWNHDVIYTFQLNHLAGVVPLHDWILFLSQWFGSWEHLTRAFMMCDIVYDIQYSRC